MAHEPIQTLEVENYGCIRKASFTLTPLHALIGPNDSGKSTALRALRTATQFGAGAFVPWDEGVRHPFDPMLARAAEPSTKISLRYGDGRGYVLRSTAGGVEESALDKLGETVASAGNRGWNVRGILAKTARQPQAQRTARADALKIELTLEPLRERLTTATMVRFDPDALRAPSRLIPESEGIRFADERGTGLASVLDAIINRYSDARSTLEADVRALFPTVTGVGLRNVSDGSKEIGATLTGDVRIGAKEMSEGLLYFIAFAALRYVDGSRLFLVEEPENGLHPSRVADVMAVLRKISEKSQVIIATHSPLVVNELEGHEVSVVTRDPTEGTRAKLLKDVPGYEEAMKVYAPGELWVSYADGKMEEPLLTGKPRA